MTPGLYDTFPGPPETFPGHIRWFPEQFDRNIDILRQINSEFIHFLGLWSPSVYLVICFLDPRTGFLDLLALLTRFLGILVHFLDFF